MCATKTVAETLPRQRIEAHITSFPNLGEAETHIAERTRGKPFSEQRKLPLCMPSRVPANW